MRYETPTIPRNHLLSFLPYAVARDEAYALSPCLRAARRMRGNLIRPGHLRVTLCPLRCGRAELDDILSRLEDLIADVALRPVRIRFDIACSFWVRPENHPFVLKAYHGTEARIDLQHGLSERLVRAGLCESGRSYTPHMTLIWADRQVEECPVLPISWIASEIVLVRSHVGLTRHEHVSRWPLKD